MPKNKNPKKSKKRSKGNKKKGNTPNATANHDLQVNAELKRTPIALSPDLKKNMKQKMQAMRERRTGKSNSATKPNQSSITLINSLAFKAVTLYRKLVGKDLLNNGIDQQDRKDIETVKNADMQILELLNTMNSNDSQAISPKISAHQRLGFIGTWLGKHNNATFHHNEALKLEDDDEHRYNLALAYRNNGQYKMALLYFEPLLGTGPQNWQAEFSVYKFSQRAHEGIEPDLDKILACLDKLESYYQDGHIDRVKMGEIYADWGLLYTDGRLIGKDESRSREYYQKAADCGNSYGLNVVANNLSGRDNKANEVDSAIEKYRLALKSSSIHPEVASEIKLNLAITIINKDNATASELDETLQILNSGANKERKSKQVGKFNFELANYYSRPNSPPENIEKAKKYFIYFIKINDSEFSTHSMHNLGCLYHHEQNHAEAAKYFLKAAIAGHVSSQSNIGLYYQFGFGVDLDLDEAVLWLSKASEHSEEAKAELRAVYLDKILETGLPEDNKSEFIGQMKKIFPGNFRIDINDFLKWHERHGAFDLLATEDDQKRKKDQYLRMGENHLPTFISTNKHIIREANKSNKRINRRLLKIFIILENIEVYNAINLATAINNIGKLAKQLGPNRPDLLAYRKHIIKLIGRITNKVADFDKQGLLNVIHGIAQLNLQVKKSEKILYCLDLLIGRLTNEMLSSLAPKQLVTLTTAIAFLNLNDIKCNEYLSPFLQQLVTKKVEFSAEERIQLFYALLMIDANHHGLVEESFMRKLFHRLQGKVKSTTNLLPKRLHQFNLCVTYISHRYKDSFKLDQLTVPDMKEAKHTPTRLETEVFTFVSNHLPKGEICKTEEMINGLPVDLLLVNAQKICQIDGPTHKVYPESKADTELEQTCKDVFLSKLLSYSGMQVVHISYDEWDNTKNLPEQRIIDYFNGKGIMLEMSENEQASKARRKVGAW